MLGGRASPQDSSVAVTRRSLAIVGYRDVARATAHAQSRGTKVRRQSSRERTVQVGEAQDAAAAGACPALQKVDAPTALVAIRREVGVAEEPEFSHRCIEV